MPPRRASVDAPRPTFRPPLGLLVLLIAASGIAILPAPSSAAASVPEIASTSGPNPPLGVHLSFNGPGTATFTWHTASASTSRAEWGTSPGPPYPNAAAGTDYLSPGNERLHTVTITGLAGSTVYHYRLGDASMNSWFGQGTFRSAPDPGAADTFTIAAAGDWGNWDATSATAAAIASWDPDLALLLGDHYYSDDEADVKGLFERWEPFASGAFAMQAMGNHEYKTNGDKYTTPTPVHCAYVNLPGNERTYAFTYGNTFFLSADFGKSVTSQTDGVDASQPNCGGTEGTPAIRAWMDAQLAAADADASIRWKIVFLHFQCYLTDFDKTSAICPSVGNPDQVEDILLNRHVDIVLTAHAHTYGRTFPVRYNQVTQAGNVYDRPGAPVYLVIGTGGSARISTCRTDAYVARCLAPTPTYGYGRFTVKPSRIDFEFVENTAGVQDSFRLYNAPPSGIDVDVDPPSALVGRNETTMATVTVVGNSPDAVGLAVSGCPPDALCGVLPSSGVPPFSAGLTITTAVTTPYGTYPVEVRGDNGTANDTATFSLTVSETVTRSYQKGDGGAYSETDDTYLYSGAPNSNYGAELQTFVDADGCIASGTVCKALLKFPDFLGPLPGQVPLGSVIESASIEIGVTDPGGLETYRQVTEAWGELTAAWNTFATPGTPANKGAAGTFTPALGRVSFNVTSVVQNWANGEANEGLLLDSLSGDGADLDASENSAGAPRLLVTYAPPGGPAPFDFAMAVNPASGSTPRGGSVSTTATATRISGDTQTVAFSCTGLPAGADCAFSPPSCDPTCSAALAITTAASTPTGTYSVRVVGANESLSREATYTLTVTDTVTVSFMKGDGGAYSETDDTYIASGAPDTNYGTQARFETDAQGCVTRSGICKGLLRFPDFIGPNAGQVPPGAAVVSAFLEITVSDGGGTQNAYRLAADWDEATATWNSFSPPGSPPTIGSSVDFPAPKSRITVNVTAFVQAWADGGANHGILIRTSSSNNARYQSSESATPPKLTVTYRLADPSGAGPDPTRASLLPGSLSLALVAPAAMRCRRQPPD